MIPSEDFKEYWAGVDAELAAAPARPELVPVPFRSIDGARLFEVRLSSVAAYRIFGYLSVPSGAGPFPAVLETPRHGSATLIPHVYDRLRYVVFTATHRGQRGSDQPYRAAYPGVLTDGIARPETYVYRAIVADCLRAAEFLLDHPQVDPARVAVRGETDLSILTAARRPGFAGVVPLGMLFHRADELRRTTSSYPLEELNDYLRADPQADIARTLSYFEPAHHAPTVTGRTLLNDSEHPLVDVLGGPVDPIELSNRGGKDADRYDAWLAALLGVPARSRFDRT